MSSASSAFDGAAFHCYGGDVSGQTTFHNAYPSKNIYFTECSGTYGSDWWSDLKWNVDHITAGAVENWARTALLWNIALDGNGNPHLPSQQPCGTAGCRPIATVNSDGSYSLNQECNGSIAAVLECIIDDPVRLQPRSGRSRCEPPR